MAVSILALAGVPGVIRGALSVRRFQGDPSREHALPCAVRRELHEQHTRPGGVAIPSAHPMHPVDVTERDRRLHTQALIAKREGHLCRVLVLQLDEPGDA